MTQISIAMATFNGERFIRRQLDSFARQTLLPSELIACDDGSTDATLSILEDFSRSAPFPVVIVKNSWRLGYTANFLQAARMCHGELIAFSDQDDDWLPQKLSRIVEASQESSALVIAHASEWIDENGNSVGVVFPTDPRFRKNLRKNDFPGHAIVLRKRLLELTIQSLTSSNYKEVAGDIEIGHDALLMEIATAMGKVLFVPEVLVRWRVHSEINHAWTQQFKPARRLSIADRIYPSDLAQRYAATGASYRKHAALLACMLRDLASSEGDAQRASAPLVEAIDWMTRQANVMDLRAKFYSSRFGKARLRLLLQGAAMGQYRRAARGGVGVHNALRDLVACFLP